MVVISNNHPAAHEDIISNANRVRSSDMHRMAKGYIVSDYQRRLIEIPHPVALNCFKPQMIKSLESTANVKTVDTLDPIA
jgi:hypothetical protein